MTHREIKAMLESTGLPVAYDHFNEGESPDPPFLCFLYPNSYNFFADDRPFCKVDELHVELYTDKKQPQTEQLVEAALEGCELCYNKTEVWIESENLYEVLYTTEVLKGEANAEE